MLRLLLAVEFSERNAAWFFMVAGSCCILVLIYQVRSATGWHYPRHVLQRGTLVASLVRSSWRPMQRRARLPQQRKRVPPRRAPHPRRGHPLRRRPSPKIPRWRPHLSLLPVTSQPGNPPPQRNSSVLAHCPGKNIFMHQAHQQITGNWVLYTVLAGPTLPVLQHNRRC